ncbi:TPA: AAA family ATPase, partial [Escherichia coli]|nr:AAA family ATPase [Escherichia coli]
GYATIGLHSVFQSCLPKPVFIKAMPTEEEAKKILNEILKMMAESTLKSSDLEELRIAQAKIKELQDKMYDSGVIEAYQNSVNGYFNKIFFDTSICFKDQKDRVVWTENKLGRDFEIEFMKKNEYGEYDEAIPSNYSSVGHGTIRTAIFTLLLMRDVAERFERKKGRKDYMVLFEEPELFLYPRIVKELRELIYQVSVEELPYQVLCASHSSAMIDLSKPKSSIIRLVNNSKGTKIYQINDSFLKDAKGIITNDELKQEMYEVLRFNPYICESFYADEVLLIEGPTEEIICRAYLQELPSSKNIFVLNCGTVNNIPFYQKIFSQFNI